MDAVLSQSEGGTDTVDAARDKLDDCWEPVDRSLTRTERRGPAECPPPDEEGVIDPYERCRYNELVEAYMVQTDDGIAGDFEEAIEDAEARFDNVENFLEYVYFVEEIIDPIADAPIATDTKIEVDVVIDRILETPEEIHEGYELLEDTEIWVTLGVRE